GRERSARGGWGRTGWMPDVPEANESHETDRLVPGQPVAAPPGTHSAGPETPAAEPPAGKPPRAAGMRSGRERPGMMPWLVLTPGHNLTYPKVVENSGLLRPGERPILLVRKHPAALIGYVVMALVVLLAAVVLGGIAAPSGTKSSITLFHHVYK